MTGHIVLLGDSIFDNSAYTGGEPDVLGHLESLLAPGWRATLCAVDGAKVAGVRSQLASVPDSATHLFVSAGGNDALENVDLLGTPVHSTGEALALFDRRLSKFESEYRAAIAEVLKLGRAVTLCTIYNGNLEPREARLARVALMMFNDAILRVAFENALNVIELRLVCTDASDYANPIEPSGKGGRKIAQAIIAATTQGAGTRVVVADVGARPAAGPRSTGPKSKLLKD